MVCLNGVHVEAQGLLSITTAVTLAVAFIMLVWGGALSTAARWSEDWQGTCSLCVSSCDFSPPSLAPHQRLSLSASSLLQDRSVRNVQDETQVLKSCNHVGRLNQKQERTELHSLRTWQCCRRNKNIFKSDLFLFPFPVYFWLLRFFF